MNKTRGRDWAAGVLLRMLTGQSQNAWGSDFALLLIGAAVSNVGISFLWPITSIYVHHVLHQPMTVVGLVMMAQAGASVVGSLVGGIVYDARGARTPILWAMALSAGVLLVLAWERDFWIYTIGMMLVWFAISATMPIFNAMAVAIWPTGGRSAFNAVYVAINAGVAVGSSLGGLLASVSFRLAFVSASFIMLALWVVMAFAYRGGAWTAAPKKNIPGRRLPAAPLWKAVGWPTVILSVALAVQWMAYDQWEVTVPNFMQAEGLILPLYSLLWTLNTVLILAAQPLLTKVVERMPRVITQLITGSVFFVLGFGTLAVFHDYAAYVGGMVLATIGEMLVLPGVPAAAEARSSSNRQGLVQGFVSMAGSIGRTAGPLAGGLLFQANHPAELFSVMVGVMAMGGVGYLVSERMAGAGWEAAAEA